MSRRIYRREPKTGRRIVRFVAVLVFLVVLAWGGGVVWFANTIPTGPEDPERKTDAIVVLTGGADRLSAGLTLLSERRAKKLFVSGVYHGVDVRELLALAQRDPSELECCVVLGYAADNTRGNALETAAWLAREGYHSIRLVTASYHMPRSLLEFRRVMKSVEIIPHAVVPTKFKQSEWWRWPGTAALIAREFDKYALARLRTLLISAPVSASRQ